MIIGLLQCDDVRPELQATHSNYDKMFAALLTTIDPEIELRVYRVIDGEYPKDIEECHGYLISGSKFSVYEELAWIHQLEAFVRTLYNAGKPTVGICFGHQMIAQALGGKVAKAEQGWGVGIADNKVINHPVWIPGNIDAFTLIVSHQDQVLTLPPLGNLIAGSNFCPISMYSVGDCFLGIQGHPEFTRSYSFDLMEARRNSIPKQVIERGQASLNRELDSECVAGWIVSFISEAGNEKNQR